MVILLEQFRKNPFFGGKETIMTNRAGTLVSNLSGEMAYESFRPAPLPPNPPIEVSGELLTKLIDANKKIATLEGLSSRIPTMELFIAMYVRKEALLSSQIEGTQCTLEMSYNTVSKVVSILVDDGILEQTDKSGKAKIFSYTEYLDILRKDT